MIIGPGDERDWGWDVLRVGPYGLVPQGCYELVVMRAAVQVWQLGVDLRNWSEAIR